MDIKTITEEQKAVLESAVVAAINSRQTGQSAIQAVYPAPTVRPVSFGVLQPDVTGVDNVEIVVEYDAMPSNDILSFYWNGDTTSIAPVPADAKPKVVSVPAALVIAAASKDINVVYSVTDAANPAGVVSEVLHLTVEQYTQEPVVTAVTITSVQDSKGTPISNGGTTTDTTVTVQGTVTYA